MDLKEKLESEIGPANWNDLSVFAKRGTLIYYSFTCNFKSNFYLVLIYIF